MFSLSDASRMDLHSASTAKYRNAAACKTQSPAEVQACQSLTAGWSSAVRNSAVSPPG